MNGQSPMWKRILYAAIPALCLFTSCSGATSQPPSARNGTIDLRGWDFSRQGPVRLTGDWSFYWNELLTPEEVARTAAPAMIRMPSNWEATRPAGAPERGLGYATHALNIRLDRGRQQMALRIEETIAASRLWINGNLVLENGVVGQTRNQEISGSRPRVITFWADQPDLQLVFQVSNFFHYDGGPVGWIRLGLPSQIEPDVARTDRFDFVVMGGAGILSVYCLFLFLSRTAEKTHLYFSFLCAVIVMRVFVSNWHITDAFPAITDAVQLRLDYFTLFTAPPMYLAFVRTLFPQEVPRRIEQASVAFAFLAILTLSLPTWIFTRMREPAEAAGTLVIGCALVCIIRAGIRGRDGAWFLAVSSALALIAVVYDILHRTRVVYGQHDLFPFSLVLLICSHSVVLGRRFSTAFNTSERLSAELRELNLSLEQRVAERTMELEKIAATDALTDLPNRGRLLGLAEVEVARAIRHKKSLAALMIDVDHFKPVNDTLGHVVGDNVLRALAAALRQSLRAHDIAGRYGGEEFVVVLPELDEAGGVAAAERLRQILASVSVPASNGPVSVTVSIGVASVQDSESLERLLSRADQALYASKAAGRNCVTAFSALRGT